MGEAKKVEAGANRGNFCLLKAWCWVMLRVKMIPANPLKQKLGFQIKWLGALPNSQMGFLTIPEEKLLRVQQRLELAIRGELPLSEYRSLLGFLEWFSWILIYARERMFGLYRPLRSGHEMEMGPATIVNPDERMQRPLPIPLDGPPLDYGGADLLTRLFCSDRDKAAWSANT